MKLFFLLSLVALAASQTEDDIINQKGLELFGPLDDDDANNTDATVTERQAPSNSEGLPQNNNIAECICVPYNLCASSEPYNPEITGVGFINPRARDDDCPVREEICCTVFALKQDPGPVRNTEGFGPRFGIRNTGGIGLNNTGSELFGPLDDDDANNTDATVTERQAPSNSEQPPQNNNIAECICVPYNLCASSEPFNPEITGVGYFNPRARDDVCPVREEICCTVLKQDPGPVRNIEGFGPLCGIRNTGGIGLNNTSASAQFAEFPWVVGLFKEMDRSDAYIGAGALIRPAVVITVAHIAGNYTAGNLWVRAGEWDLRSKNELYYHSERGVREIYVAEDFDYKTHRNDLAMLRLKQAFPINELINVVCLSASMYNTFDMNSACLANGWGQTAFSNNKMEPSPLLKKVDLKVIESQKCTEVLQQTRLGPNYTVHSSFICAIGDNGADMCQGDGGGPLACEDQGRYQLRGLVSYGVGCGVRNRPAVYTNINEFIGLIEDKLRDWDLEDDETNSI